MFPNNEEHLLPPDELSFPPEDQTLFAMAADGNSTTTPLPTYLPTLPPEK
jgi:hypothetical protein